MVKKLLQRSNNLRRVNFFTTNYDMAFDYALDNLGVDYINGFMGVHNRCFRPEVYDYDLYYPGQSVSGKVHRAEKVLKYYKLHGSLSWVSAEATFSNSYGICELPLNNLSGKINKELLIYPCSTKKTFTLDLPYSELFRQFSQAINQPQSVLICIGYSFYDEHINDIIRQALSNPSFTLIVANYKSTSESESRKKKKVFPVFCKNKGIQESLPENPIEELKNLEDPRIIILPQENIELSTFIGFIKNVMPDLYEEDEKEFVNKTVRALHGSSNNGDNGGLL